MSSPVTRRMLGRAYRATDYCVVVDAREIVLHIGRDIGGDVRTALSTAGACHHCSLVTPCNPRSHLLTQRENQQRLNRLERALADRRQLWLPTMHRDPAGRWPDEAGVCLLDPPRGLALRLARVFDQHALISFNLEGAPRLRWC